MPIRTIVSACIVALWCACGPSLAAADEHATLYVLLDGFRWDLVSPQDSPNLDRLSKRGVRGEMIPVWPTISSPNHWALATGLYPKHGGVYHNEMFDPVTKVEQKPYTASAMTGEPIWAAVARQGLISGSIGRWVGVWKMEPERSPSYYIPFDDLAFDSANLVLTLLEQKASEAAWNKGLSKRPRLLTLYSAAIDIAEHEHGVNSIEAKTALRRVDSMMGQIIDGLAVRGLGKEVNIVIVADHGQTNTVETIDLYKMFDKNQLEIPPVGFPPSGVWPKPGLTETVYQQLKGLHPRLHVYRREELPARFNCCHPDPAKAPPIWILPDPGWEWLARDLTREKRLGNGAHGYDNQVRDMHAIFIAAGPDIRPGASLEPFNNVDVYSLLAHLLKIQPAKTDGTIDAFCGILVNPPAACTTPNRVVGRL
jgi:predicted AlkP superfamily pyrophosphatase or phosphodiesterase